MPRYVVILTDDEIQELKALVQKGGKGYRIRHAQILLKLDQRAENRFWTYQLQQGTKSFFHMIHVDTASTFVTKWNAMGLENGKTVSIENVIINVHGAPLSIYASDSSAINISDLQQKNIGNLLLFSCNTGHLDYTNNVANQFLQTQNIGVLVAPDGTHFRDIVEMEQFFNVGYKNYTEFNDVSQVYQRKANGGFRQSRGLVFYLNGNMVVPTIAQTQYTNVMDLISKANKLKKEQLEKFRLSPSDLIKNTVKRGI